jgi:hypothetical protein
MLTVLAMLLVCRHFGGFWVVAMYLTALTTHYCMYCLLQVNRAAEGMVCLPTSKGVVPWAGARLPRSTARCCSWRSVWPRCLLAAGCLQCMLRLPT